MPVVTVFARSINPLLLIRMLLRPRPDGIELYLAMVDESPWTPFVECSREIVRMSKSSFARSDDFLASSTIELRRLLERMSSTCEPDLSLSMIDFS